MGVDKCSREKLWNKHCFIRQFCAFENISRASLDPFSFFHIHVCGISWIGQKSRYPTEALFSQIEGKYTNKCCSNLFRLIIVCMPSFVGRSFVKGLPLLFIFRMVHQFGGRELNWFRYFCLKHTYTHYRNIRLLCLKMLHVVKLTIDAVSQWLLSFFFIVMISIWINLLKLVMFPWKFSYKIEAIFGIYRFIHYFEEKFIHFFEFKWTTFTPKIVHHLFWERIIFMCPFYLLFSLLSLIINNWRHADIFVSTTVPKKIFFQFHHHFMSTH